MNTIPHSRPWLGNAEIRAAAAVIRSGHLSQDKAVLRLEKQLANMTRHRHAVAVSSGSAGLFLSFKALGIGKGDGIVIPTYACTALLNAVLLAGAKPILADVDPQTGNITNETVKKALTRKAKAIVAVHLWGNPAPAKDIEKEFGIPVIEDCAQSIGANINGRPVGGETAISLFSFYTTKMAAAGEGGTVCTSNFQWAQAVRSWREYDNADALRPCFNFKLTDLQAAVAGAQVAKIEQMVSARRQIAEYYQNELCNLDLELIPSQPKSRPAFYRFVIQSGRNPQKVIAAASKSGVSMARPIFRPLHHYLNKKGFPEADRLYGRAISIPIYPSLTKPEMRKVASVVRRIFES